MGSGAFSSCFGARLVAWLTSGGVAEQSSEKAVETGEKRSRWGHPLVPLGAIAAILVAATLAFLLLGGGGSELPNGAKAANVAGFEGEVLKPRLPAPETRL